MACGQFWPPPVLEKTFLLRERTNCCSSYLSLLRKGHNTWLYFDGINSISRTWGCCFNLYQVTQKTSSFDLCCAQSCLTLCNPMDCSPLGSSVHGILRARILEWGCHFLLKEIFPTQGSNTGILHWQAGRFITTSATWEALNIALTCMPAYEDIKPGLV